MQPPPLPPKPASKVDAEAIVGFVSLGLQGLAMLATASLYLFFPGIIVSIFFETEGFFDWLLHTIGVAIAIAVLKVAALYLFAAIASSRD